jgi:peptidoglycan-N-acetylglucosamine deacetylase
LTFDDGPGPMTPRILDILSSYNACAAFFMTGPHALAYPDLVYRYPALLLAIAARFIRNH